MYDAVGPQRGATAAATNYPPPPPPQQALVSRYGHVKRATIWRDRGTGQSKGFGLVELADSQQAAQAMDALNNLIPSEGSPPLQVEYNHPKPSKMNQGGMRSPTPTPTPPPTRNHPTDPIAPGACSNIFLKCLPLTYTDADLHNLLSSFGRIVRSTIWKDNKTNQSRVRVVLCSVAFALFSFCCSLFMGVCRVLSTTLVLFSSVFYVLYARVAIYLSPHTNNRASDSASSPARCLLRRPSRP